MLRGSSSGPFQAISADRDRAVGAVEFVLDTQHDADCNQRHQHAATTGTDQRQGKALGGQRAEVDTDADHSLQPDPQANAVSDETGERTALAVSHDTNHHDPRDQQQKQQQHRNDPGQPELFGQHGENEIGVRFREVKQLLDAGAPGLHFYTMNQADPTLAIWENLGL